MKRVQFLLGFLLLAFSRVPASDNYDAAARSAAMAHASVTVTDVWAAFNNQAGLAFLEKTSAGVSFENRFTVANLNVESFALGLPSKAGTFGFSASVFGYSLYNEKKAGLAYARKFGEKISAGIQLDYLNTFIGDNFYGSKSTLAAEAGILAEPISNFKIGVHVFNLTQSRLAEYADERIPTIFRVGASYRFSEKVFWSVEEQKDIDQTSAFKSGLEYHPCPSLFLRTGIGTNPTLFTFGFGLKHKQIQLDAASSYHRELGFSPAFSINYEFN